MRFFLILFFFNLAFAQSQTKIYEPNSRGVEMNRDFSNALQHGFL